MHPCPGGSLLDEHPGANLVQVSEVVSESRQEWRKALRRHARQKEVRLGPELLQIIRALPNEFGRQGSGVRIERGHIRRIVAASRRDVPR